MPQETLRAHLAALPEQYRQNPACCQNFCLHVRNTENLHDDTAAHWECTGLGHGGGPECISYSLFLQQFKTVFYHPYQGQSSSQLLLKFHQGLESAVEYSIRFHILAADSGWNDPALITLFHDGLSAELQGKLACRDTDLNLYNLIMLAIKLDQKCGKVQPPASLLKKSVLP